MLNLPEPEGDVLFLGDTHGVTSTVILATMFVSGTGNTIFQLGDFALTLVRHAGPRWEHSSFLRGIDAHLAAAEVHLYFIRGNHDHQPFLGYTPDGYRDPDDLLVITPNITFIPDAARWTWNGVSFLAMGGGVSVDKGAPHRRPGHGWYATEVMYRPLVDRAMSEGHADVMLTHDCPTGTQILSHKTGENAGYWPERNILDSEMHAQELRLLVDKVRPQRLVHGHYHYGYNDVLLDGNGEVMTSVTGLGCNGQEPENLLLSSVPDLLVGEVHS